MIKLNLDKNKKYLLACSFGPDSMALFHLLQENGYIFDCAIVNYHLRKESDFEVESLIRYASHFGVKVHVYNVEETINKNIEARCREIRYNFFKQLTDRFGYNATLVAQHQDDHIETYLLQKQRQNFPIFYGIKEKTIINGVQIIRPLLDYSKGQLLDICKQADVPFSIDQSNFDTKIKRNKIRHEIVSKYSQEERLKILAEIVDENRNLSVLLNSLNNEKLCEVDYILSLVSIKQSYALNLVLNNSGIQSNLSKANVGQCISVLKSDKPNGQFLIKTSVYLIKEYESFCFSSSKLSDVDYEFKLVNPGVLDTPYFYLDFSKDSKSRNVYESDYPLTIRHLKKDDIYIINGYKVSARRLLIDWKVPYRKRLIWPAILNKSRKVIYIPRYQKDFKPDSASNFYVK